MKRKWLIVVTVVIIISVIFWKGNGFRDSKEQRKNTVDFFTMESENLKKKREQNEGYLKSENQSLNGDWESESPDTKLNDRKIELTDYIELSIEDFIKETGISLQQKDKDMWETEDNIIKVKICDNRIVYLSINIISSNVEEIPYTIAGISLNEDISNIKNTVLKEASMESGHGIGYNYYTSLEFSRLGIERLTLWEMGIIKGIEAELDLTLKQYAEGLDYICGEKVCQKEGIKNSELITAEAPYTKLPQSYYNLENIDKTVVLIKYPYIEISGNLKKEENANNLIKETIEQIEDMTYRKTDENIIVCVDYWISYKTSKFISITFTVDIISNTIDKHDNQYCNINIAGNGEGTTLADVGITRNDVITACNIYQEILDVEGYLEKHYDTSWNQYRILPTKYQLFIPVLGEESELQGENVSTVVEIDK